MPKWGVIENLVLQNFLAEKSQNSQTPLNFRELSKEYKRRYGAQRSQISIENRIHKFRNNVHLMENIDVETKETLMLALRKPARTHSHVPWTEEEHADLVEFLLEESEKSDVFNASKLSKDYAESDRTTRTQLSVEKKIFLLRQKVNITCDTDKAAMMSALRTEALDIPKPEDFIISHRWNQTELDSLETFVAKKLQSSNTISHTDLAREYQKTSETPRPFTGLCAKIASIRKRMGAKTRIEMTVSVEQVLGVLADICKECVEPISDFDFVRAFLDKFPNAVRYEQYLFTQYRNAKNRIALCEDYEEIERVKMLFVSGTPVGPGLLEGFRKSAFVELDYRNLIARYKSSDGELVMNRYPDENEDSLVFPKADGTLSEPLGISKPEDVKQDVFEIKSEEPEI